MPLSATELLPDMSGSPRRGAKHWKLKIFRRKLQLLVIVCVAVVVIYTFTSTTSHSRSSHELQVGRISDECLCRYNNISYDFCYHLPQNRSIKGLRFNCKYASYLDSLDLLEGKHLIDLSEEDLPTPAFVTAMSENHYDEGLTLIAYMRKLWPRQKIIVYDLGLETNSAKDLKSKCLVELRKFPFNKYPSNVKELTQFRWKPLLIAMALEEHGAVWYMDTSVRWEKDRRDVVYKELTCRRKTGSDIFSTSKIARSSSKECGKPAYMLHYPSGHSIFATTNKGNAETPASVGQRKGSYSFTGQCQTTLCKNGFMNSLCAGYLGTYAYIPTNIEAIKTKESENHDANFAFIVKTADAVEILKWYVLCALEQDCIAPPKADLWCRFTPDRFNDYAHCHRYDQSVINLLLANSYGYNIKNYVSSLGDGASIMRAAKPHLTEKDFACIER